MNPAVVRPGETVKIISGDLTGSVGVIASVYNGGRECSLRIRPDQCTDRSLVVNRDGFVHWLSHAHEIEIYNQKLRFT